MADKFQNKYRIPSARASWQDYSANGTYFITICTTGRECLFGSIIAPTHGCTIMQLSDIGEIVKREWEKSFSIRAELFCDEFVIMPNHLHAILRIENRNSGKNGSQVFDEPNDINAVDNSDCLHVETHGCASLHCHVETYDGVETHGRASLPPTGPSIQQPSNHPFNMGIAYRPPKSISSFVAGFKSAVTKQVNEYRNSPKEAVWQSRFHDHIIRNDEEYQRICDYIVNNPANWESDKFYEK